MDASDLAGIAAHTLRRAGSDILFGIPGGGNNLELVGAAEAAGMRFVLAHSETAAVIMAGVYAELTGHPCACVVTRGPGAASAVNGVAQAWLDRQPVLLLTDAVSSAERHRVTHQRLDQTALLGNATKRSGVLGHHDPEVTMDRALRLALAPPAGPVHLDLDPSAPGGIDPTPPPPPGRLVSDADAERAAALLRAARRPVLIAGVGALGAVEAVRALVINTGVPVLMTYKAKGVIPDSWPNAAGLFTGATVEAPVLRAADLILTVGLDAVELIPGPWPYPAPVVSLAAWPREDGYLVPEVELVGDLADLIARVDTGLTGEWERDFGRAQRDRTAARLLAAHDGTVTTAEVVSRARARSAPGTVATVDSGAHMLATMPLWEVEAPGEVLISSGLATMGFALPAAIGAALARPDARVVCFVGDGGLGMTLAELETVARLGLRITVVVLNDSALSLIAVKQKPTGHGGAAAVAYRDTDFAAIAAGAGLHASRVRDIGEFEKAFDAASRSAGPCLLDVLVDGSVYPRVLEVIRGSSNLVVPAPATAAPRPRVLLLEPIAPRATALLRERADVVTAFGPDARPLAETLPTVDAIIVRKKGMTAEMLGLATRLRVISRPGVGYERTDMAAVTAAGVPFLITANANYRTVAEHSIALALAALRAIPWWDRHTRRGGYADREQRPGRELWGGRLGVIGVGRIGTEIGRIAREGFGMTVLGYHPTRPPEDLRARGLLPYQDLHAFLAECDVVSVQVPLTEHTRNLIDTAELARMRPGSVLVNIARGGVVNEAALLAALRDGPLGAAGIDVFDADPPPPDHPFFALDNVVLSPHRAGRTGETQERMGAQAIEGLFMVLEGRARELLGESAPALVVNPTVLDGRPE
jgi:acetolactate synthase-1/2/3 large subunit